MHVFIYAVALSHLLLGAASRQFAIPAIQSVVQSALASHGNYSAYHGPTSAAPPSAKATGKGGFAIAAAPYWLESINHQGVAPFAPGGYRVFRNVRDFGARGDGVTDDTAAINAAISSGDRCGQGCPSSTITPALVYFPAGTYLVSYPIFDFYYTQLVGNPNDLPTIKVAASFSAGWVIDADPYFTSVLNWGSTNVFFRQIRNLVFDLTSVPSEKSISAIHWPTAQATSLQNLRFEMSRAAGTRHQGIFMEEGSGGLMVDLTFNGGYIGMAMGNQQFTMRNLVFNGCVTAISQIWDWGWTYKSLSINNCQVGIDMSSGGRTGQTVGSVTLLDSAIRNTPVGILTAHDSSSSPPTAGSLIIENVQLVNVGVAVQGPNGVTALAGTTGSTTIAAWGEGHSYTPNGPNNFQGTFAPLSRPGSLLSGNGYYERSKPQYENLGPASFSSVRSGGAIGDGNTDDTTVLQNIIDSAASAGRIVFFDAGIYKITRTLTIPPGSKIVGEAYPVILSSGSFFNDMSNPQPVVRVGSPGSTGEVEWSDMIVSTQGAQAGAILIEWNLSSRRTGMWDVHTRVGGFAGSQLQVAQCPKTPGNPTVNPNCIAAYMLMHVTPSASGLYMENCWFWTADHDIDSGGNTQITVYSGRGLYIESSAGTIWLYGTAVEHNVLYQYQLANTQNIVMGQIQTETAYYQPTPNALTPFPPVSSLNDPDFASSCSGQGGNCAEGWGLRIINSHDILVPGAGLYSFFADWSTTCSNQNGPENCQNNIFSIESSNNIEVFNLNTVGTQNMVTRDGNSLARYSDNVNVFPDTIALFKSN